MAAKLVVAEALGIPEATNVGFPMKEIQNGFFIPDGIRPQFASVAGALIHLAKGVDVVGVGHDGGDLKRLDAKLTDQ